MDTDSLAIIFGADGLVTGLKILQPNYDIFHFFNLENHAELYDETNYIKHGKLKKDTKITRYR